MIDELRGYCSPRWSGEILDCSMPMTFDTYNKCSFNCLYCFSFFQKSHSMVEDNYQKGGDLGAVSVETIRRLFALDETLSDSDKQFFPYIRDRKVMQWGGLADQFDMHEKKYGRTLELLKVLKEHNYPLCFSTKATWWLQDERYRELFKGQDNWNCKFSIINLNAESARKMEKGVPTPMERIKAIGEYTKLNKGGATLRLRPFIIGLTDKDNEHLEVIRLAREHGADAISTEFFCLERRADDRLLAKYKEMSNIIGFDILMFYRKHSRGAGYSRLNYNIKKKYVEEMHSLCKEIGMRFYVSDAHHKEKCDNGSCCGLPPTWNYSRGQFTEALIIAKKNGKVSWTDIEPHLDMYKKFRWVESFGFNTCGALARAKRKDQTMYDYFKEAWNEPNNAHSPYKYFGGVLYPISKDNENNIIYEYREK